MAYSQGYRPICCESRPRCERIHASHQLNSHSYVLAGEDVRKRTTQEQIYSMILLCSKCLLSFLTSEKPGTAENLGPCPSICSAALC